MTSSKKPRTLLGSVPSKKVALVVTRKPRLTASLMPFDSEIIAAFAANRKVVMFALTVQMHREGEVLGRRKLRQTALEFERVGAQVDVLLARNQPVDDLDDLRMQQRLAAREEKPWARRTLQRAAKHSSGVSCFLRM